MSNAKEDEKNGEPMVQEQSEKTEENTLPI